MMISKHIYYSLTNVLRTLVSILRKKKISRVDVETPYIKLYD